MGFRRAGGLVFAWRAGVVPHRPLVLVSSSWAPRPAGFFARGRRGIGARKPAGPCFSVSFAPSPRAQTKSDARRLPPSCITFPPLYFQKERIDDEDSRPPFVVNSNHLLVPLALICIRHHKKLTTERLEPRFRRQFLPISRKRPELEAARGRPCWRRPSCEALFFRQVAPTPPGFPRAVAGHVGAVRPAKPYFFAGSRQHAPVFPGQSPVVLAPSFLRSLISSPGHANRRAGRPVGVASPNTSRFSPAYHYFYSAST